MGLAFGSACLLGVAVALHGASLSVIVLGACLALLAWILPRRAGRLAACGLLGLASGFGLTSLRATEPAPAADLVGAAVVEGRVSSDPRLGTRGSSARLVWTMADGEQIESLMFFSGVVEPGRGERIEVSGEWSEAGGGLLFVERLTIVEPAGRVERLRRSLRATARARILARVPGSQGSLALGLVIGDDSGLTEQERDNLRYSGLSHITAVSGSNVLLVIVAVSFLLRALDRNSWIWFGAQLVAVVFYVWIVGLEPPIVRAAIMGSLVLLAGMIGRPAHLFTILALAGAVMCLQDPNVLLSLGFQLSFLAMIGLALAGDVISRSKGRSQKVVAALLSPAAAALLTAPLLAARFGTFSPGTLPANVAVAPFVGLATLLSGLVALIPDGFLSGDLAGFGAWLLTGLILEISNVVGGSSLALVSFTPLTLAQTAGVYALLAAFAAPLVPEARLTGHRIRLWATVDPARGVVTTLAGAAMLAVFAQFLD